MRAPPYSERADELFSPECMADPFPLYARLRRERPISRVGDTGVHLVATWDLIDEVLHREGDFSANLTGVLMRGEDGEPAVFDLGDNGANHVIATADDPAHAVHRRLAQPRFAALHVAALAEPIRAFAREALTPWLGAGGGDFVPVAERVPARVVAAVLGLPDGDVSRHRKWAMMGGDMLAGDVTPAALVELSRETREMIAYLGVHLAQARSLPASESGGPLLAALARGVDRGEIREQEAVGIAVVMFGAGGESTAAYIELIVRRLAEDPALAQRLRADLSLVPRFIEEVARLESPFKCHYRVVRRPCELGGATLEPDDRLMLLWPSANRDETHFEHPDELRLDRRHPKHHMSFGRGTHFCIGAPLARLEAQIVCEHLLTGSRELSLREDDPPVYARSLFVRRLDRLAVCAER